MDRDIELLMCREAVYEGSMRRAEKLPFTTEPQDEVE
jgi:hypothetical protein